MSTSAPLTRTERDLLTRLFFRADLGQSYLVQAGRGRIALVVPQMLDSNPLSRSRAYNWPTIRSLIARGLIEVPDGHEPLRFAHRERLDSDSGERVNLTAEGHDIAKAVQAR
jgi:hypothetical protein